MARGRSIRDLFVRIGIDADDAPLRQIDRGVDSLKSNLKTLKRVAIGVFGAGGIAGFLFNLAGGFEQTQISFEVMLGSAEKAKKLLDELFQFAKKTPFTISGVLDAARQLLAFGIPAENLINNLTILGNVAAGTVGPGQSLSENFAGLARNFGQVRTQMRLLGKDANDFANRGVPIFDEVAKAMGVSTTKIREMGSQGKVSFDIVEQAFQNMSNEGGKFFNLMERQSNTALGLLSNVLDTFTLIAKDISDVMLVPMKKLQLSFLAFLEINKKFIIQRGRKIFTEIGNGILFALKVAKGFISTLVDLTQIVGGLENAIKLTTAALFLMFSISVLSGIGNLAIGLVEVAKAFVGIGTAAGIAQIKAFAFPLLVGSAILALILIVDDLVAAFRGQRNVIVEFFEKKFPTAFKVTKDALAILKDSFSDFFDFIQKKSTIETFASALNKIADFAFGKLPRAPVGGGAATGGLIPSFQPAQTIQGNILTVPLPQPNLPPVTFGDITVITQPGADADEIVETFKDKVLFPAFRATRPTEAK